MAKIEFVKTLNKVAHLAAKHSPLILTIAGIGGIGATAYATYKSAKKVDKIVSRVEEQRKAEDTVGFIETSYVSTGTQMSTEIETEYKRALAVGQVNRLEVAKDLAGAVALPVALGIGSVVCIGLSYHIQNRRIFGLAGALAAVSAERAYFADKYKEQYGEAEYKKFVTPTEKDIRTVETGDGTSEEVHVGDSPKDVASLHGAWFEDSSEYVVDDHGYNLAVIRNVDEKMQLKLFQRGFLLLNDVLEELGLPRTRYGALVGWQVAGFNLDTEVINALNEQNGMFYPKIYVSWTTPKYIYNDIEFK